MKKRRYLLPVLLLSGMLALGGCGASAQSIGQTIFAFGLLFLGIETMGDVMKPLASSPVFTNLIGQVANIPILGVAAGTLMTLVVQSSSATIAVLQNFASQAGPDGEINDYIAELFSSGSLTEQQATQTARLLCVLSDITRMGNLAADMADFIEEKAEKKYTFSEEAHREINDGMEQITRMYEDSIAAMTRGEFGSLANILRDNEDILNLDVDMRQSHMQRVQDGKCKKELTAPFTQILNCIDRMWNNCVNLAEGAMDQMSFGYFIGEARE